MITYNKYFNRLSRVDLIALIKIAEELKINLNLLDDVLKIKVLSLETGKEITNLFSNKNIYQIYKNLLSQILEKVFSIPFNVGFTIEEGKLFLNLSFDLKEDLHIKNSEQLIALREKLYSKVIENFFPQLDPLKEKLRDSFTIERIRNPKITTIKVRTENTFINTENEFISFFIPGSILITFVIPFLFKILDLISPFNFFTKESENTQFYVR